MRERMQSVAIYRNSTACEVVKVRYGETGD